MLKGEAPARTESCCSSSTPGAPDLLTVHEPSLGVTLQRLDWSKEAGVQVSGILPAL